jgi:hypothetical protein
VVGYNEGGIGMMYHLFSVFVQETFIYAWPWVVLKLGIIVAKIYSHHNYFMYEEKRALEVILASWMTLGNVVLFIFI